MSAIFELKRNGEVNFFTKICKNMSYDFMKRLNAQFLNFFEA